MQTDLMSQIPLVSNTRRWNIVPLEQVITLPESGHDLRSARFYMLIIRGGAADLVGAVHFRQDQLQIDLFVFFSVFLAAFFLFVSVCIIIWQVG